jgi:hypothetical protein
MLKCNKPLHNIGNNNKQVFDINKYLSANDDKMIILTQNNIIF